VRQKLGKNQASLELFLGNSSWQIDERQKPLRAASWLERFGFWGLGVKF